MTIQITKTGTVCLGSKKDLEEIKTRLSDELYIKLPNFLSPELLKSIQQNIESAEYYTLDHGDAGLDLRMVNNSTHDLLHRLVNDRKFLDLFEKITDRKKIKYFTGRIYKMTPGQGHYDKWHTDISWHRILTLSINLSTDIYSGGILQIRDRKTKKIIQEISNTVPGDAIIFPISTHLEHMLTPVEGNISKIAFAGWFSSEIPYESFIKSKSLDSSNDSQEIHLRISKDSVIQAKKGLLYEDFGREQFVFDTDNETGFGLDSLGTVIWNLLQDPITVIEIRDQILNNFDVNPKKCEQDLLFFLQELQNAGLLVIGGQELSSSSHFLAFEKELV